MANFQNMRGGGNIRPDKQIWFFRESAPCRIILQTWLALCLVISPACAQDLNPPSGNSPATHIGDADTHLAVDTQNNIIHIMIDGHEVGRFDKNGLHVVGDIEYTGSTTDTTAVWLSETPVVKGKGHDE